MVFSYIAELVIKATTLTNDTERKGGYYSPVRSPVSVCYISIACYESFFRLTICTPFFIRKNNNL